MYFVLLYRLCVGDKTYHPFLFHNTKFIPDLLFIIYHQFTQNIIVQNTHKFQKFIVYLSYIPTTED